MGRFRWYGGASAWFSELMTVLVTRRHVDFVRVTALCCPTMD
jgi:hypothetical protein